MRSFAFSLAASGVLLLAGVGCRPPSGEAGHDEPRTAQITVWTDQYEVFAEHRAPVAGKATTFITHVTDLLTLEPRRDGMVKFLLRQGDRVVEHPQAAPARAGIYLPGLVFPSVGEWSLTLLVPAGGTNASVELGVITVYKDQDDADHAVIPDAPGGVSFLKEQQWKIGSQTEPVASQRLVEQLKAPARVMAKPGSRGAVVAPVAGQLAAPESALALQPGRRVEADELLALLKPNFSEAAARLVEADSGLAAAKAELAQAEAAYERTRVLAAAQAKSERELQEARLAYESAESRYAAAAGLIETFRQSESSKSADAPLRLELRAPISGILSSVAAGPGEVVAAGQAVFTVVNPDTVWIAAQIPETKVGLLSSAGNATLELPARPGEFLPVTGDGRGHLVSLGVEVDAVARTVPLIYELLNPGDLLIGQMVSLYVETARAEETLAVPDSSIIEEDGRPIAFVQLSGETFEKRDLELGIRNGHQVQILSGLVEGERIVTKGAYAVRLASVSSAIPAHGHVH
ncbi:MAG: efflux RND transporter periplasmic adaptor subunit [Limisphaerales bacterium]